MIVDAKAYLWNAGATSETMTMNGATAVLSEAVDLRKDNFSTGQTDDTSMGYVDGGAELALYVQYITGTVATTSTVFDLQDCATVGGSYDTLLSKTVLTAVFTANPGGIVAKFVLPPALKRFLKLNCTPTGGTPAAAVGTYKAFIATV